ncbi:MAG: phage integrase N-terminal SAM-like domain-containing protein, partial [Clostridia bacterium]|nr:phage integrase N-terminal SAM-like domain-containing protein [Clostridia bacterium]
MIEQNELPVYAQDFLAYMGTIKNCSENTIKEYFYDLRMFLRFLDVHKNKNPLPFDEIAVGQLSINAVKDTTLSDLYAYMTYLSR